MVNILNQKELISTFDMKRMNQIVSKLCEHGIDYRVKTVDRNQSPVRPVRNRAFFGSFGEKVEIEKEYSIFVKKVITKKQNFS